MTLSEIMSHAGLAIYAEIALILFFLTFVVVLVRLLRPSRRAEYEATGRLPLDDEPTAPKGDER